MADKKTARPGVVTPGQAAERAAFGGAAISCNNSTSNSTKKQGKIEGLLQRGADKAISSADLARLAGCSSVRQLQERIATEREAGALILSTCRNGGGYYLPADGPAGREEIEEYMRTLRARALNTLRALKSAKTALEALPGQVSFECNPKT